jgi:hypothetical protein
MLYVAHARKRRKFLGFSPLFLSLCPFIYKDDRNFGIVHMLFEEIDTEDSASSLSEASSLDDDLDRTHLESDTSDEESSDGEIDSQVSNKIE